MCGGVGGYRECNRGTLSLGPAWVQGHPTSSPSIRTIPIPLHLPVLRQNHPLHLGATLSELADVFPRAQGDGTEDSGLQQAWENALSQPRPLPH